MRRTAVFIAMLILSLTPLRGQVMDAAHMNVTARTYYTRFFNSLQIVDNMLERNGYPTYDVALGFSARPEDRSPYAEAFNFPTAGVGFSLAPLSTLPYKDKSHFSDFYTAYAFFESDILRTRRVSLGYMFKLGAAYSHDTYDPVENPDNRIVSSQIMAFIAAGGYLHYRLTDHLETGLEALAWHHSNARLGLPNNGLNEYAAGAFLRYHITEPYTGPRSRKTEKLFDRGLSWDVYAAGGGHCCAAEWEVYNKNVPAAKDRAKGVRCWPKATVGVGAMYRYSLMGSAGVHMEGFWNSNIEALRHCDPILYGEEEAAGLDYRRWALGIAAMQEFHYGRFSADIAMGVYLYKRLGLKEDMSPFYQRVGIRYYFPSLGGMFLSASCKAHYFSRAEYMEFGIGFRL